MNASLQALASTNSGATAPSTTYANMLWYDTAANILYMRSEANDNWIKLGELDQSALTFAPENAVPSGAVVYLARSTAPSGWLKANGAAVSRTTYSKLFAAIGTTWGAGNGSTTFNVPDLRGEFMRGWDDGRGVDGGRSFSSLQLDQMQRVQGQLSGVVFTGAAGQSGALSTAQTFAGVYGVGGNGTERVVGFDSGGSANARVSADSSGETRPRNRALLACIKF
jgi:phage-related tail fiber protein